MVIEPTHASRHNAAAARPTRQPARPARLSRAPIPPAPSGASGARAKLHIAAHVRIPAPASPLSSSKGDWLEPNRFHRVKHAVSGSGNLRAIIVRKGNPRMGVDLPCPSPEKASPHVNAPANSPTRQARKAGATAFSIQLCYRELDAKWLFPQEKAASHAHRSVSM